VIFRIQVPKEHPAMYVDDISQNRGEREVILPRNSTLLGLEVERDQYGRMLIECLAIPPTEAKDEKTASSRGRKSR
jgi:hypothetical protein